MIAKRRVVTIIHNDKGSASDNSSYADGDGHEGKDGAPDSFNQYQPAGKTGNPPSHLPQFPVYPANPGQPNVWLPPSNQPGGKFIYHCARTW